MTMISTFSFRNYLPVLLLRLDQFSWQFLLSYKCLDSVFPGMHVLILWAGPMWMWYEFVAVFAFPLAQNRGQNTLYMEGQLKIRFIIKIYNCPYKSCIINIINNKNIINLTQTKHYKKTRATGNSGMNWQLISHAFQSQCYNKYKSSTQSLSLSSRAFWHVV